MKKYIHKFQLLTIFILSFSFSFGQDITPDKALVQFDGKSRACLEVEVDADPKELKKAWRDFLKQHYDLKLSGIGLFSNKDILTAEEVMVPSISSDAMDFYTKIVKDESRTRMSVFAAHGYDIYINEEDYPKEFYKVRHIMSDFIDSYVTRMYADRIEVLEEEIGEMVENQSDLKESLQDNKEEIQDLEEEVKSRKTTIEEKENSLESVETKLADKRGELKVVQSKLKAVQ